MRPIMREVWVGPHRLLQGDSLAMLPLLDGIGACVSDPPYGMDWDTDSKRFTGGQRKPGGDDGRDDWGAIESDAEPFDPAPWLAFRECILWGANHFAQRLPVGATLIWLKKPPELFGTFLSDAEIGWKKGGHGVFAHYKQFPPPSRMAENNGAVAHPTQKPVALMRWCVGMTKAETVLDPYAGSGTTGVACIREGRRFVGIEKSARHFDVMVRRVSEAYAQPDLLIPQPAPVPVQEVLL